MPDPTTTPDARRVRLNPPRSMPGSWLLSRTLRTALPLGVAIIAAGCGSRAGPPAVPALQSYSIRDTADYENTIYGGRLGVLYHDGVRVDSIDLDFGLQPVPGGVLFLSVRTEEDPELGRLTYFGEHVLYDGRNRRNFTDGLPFFDPNFSSPAVIDSLFYYWGLDREASYVYRVLAVRYDFIREGIDSTFLFRDELATDNPYHFDRPEPTDGLIRYATHGRTYWLRPDLTLVRDSIGSTGTSNPGSP